MRQFRGHAGAAEKDIPDHGTFTCYNDALPSTKTESHSDFQTVATVHHAALPGGLGDSDANDDACPHNAPATLVDPVNAAIKDNGCGAKKSDGTLGGPVLTDVVVKP